MELHLLVQSKNWYKYIDELIDEPKAGVEKRVFRQSPFGNWSFSSCFLELKGSWILSKGIGKDVAKYLFLFFE